ncbi:MAG TPA: hypothetical protein DEQ01_06655 [Thermoanaerobacter sp.]|nr:hypothetical protein [Thermoanaerobacter sp.]
MIEYLFVIIVLVFNFYWFMEMQREKRQWFVERQMLLDRIMAKDYVEYKTLQNVDENSKKLQNTSYEDIEAKLYNL